MRSESQKSSRFLAWWGVWGPVLPFVMLAIVFLCVLFADDLFPTHMAQVREKRRAAARERAGQFVRALGFEPGETVCRTQPLGSARCTVRVVGTDKTFALYCSGRRVPCYEVRGD